MKEFFRNLKKQKVVGLLNICSLSLGVMVTIIVGLWTINEMSFDRFHTNNDRIYRTVLNANLSGNPVKLGATFRPLGDLAKDELPVVEEMCRFYPDKGDIRIEDKLHQAVSCYIVDPNFFSFFTFSLKEGQSEQVLSSPDRVVISRQAASTYFPYQDPMGQVIKYQDRDFIVTGIMDDMPKNSSLQADFIFPLFGRFAEMDWGQNDNYYIFFLLQAGVNADELAEPLTQIAYNGCPVRIRPDQSSPCISRCGGLCSDCVANFITLQVQSFSLSSASLFNTLKDIALGASV